MMFLSEATLLIDTAVYSCVSNSGKTYLALVITMNVIASSTVCNE